MKSLIIALLVSFCFLFGCSGEKKDDQPPAQRKPGYTEIPFGGKGVPPVSPPWHRKATEKASEWWSKATSAGGAAGAASTSGAGGLGIAPIVLILLGLALVRAQQFRLASIPLIAGWALAILAWGWPGKSTYGWVIWAAICGLWAFAHVDHETDWRDKTLYGGSVFALILSWGFVGAIGSGILMNPTWWITEIILLVVSDVIWNSPELQTQLGRRLTVGGILALILFLMA